MSGVEQKQNGIHRRDLVKLEHGLVDDRQGDGISGVSGGNMYTNEV